MPFANNLAAAMNTIDHVRWICRYGAANKDTDKERTSKNRMTLEPIDELPTTVDGLGSIPVSSVTQHLKFLSENEFFTTVPDEIRRDSQIPIDAAIAAKYRVGNCEEQASVAFEYLRKQLVSPIDFVTFPAGNHAFVVIGMSGDSSSWESWGSDAVVCDAWANEHPNPQSDAHWEDYPYRPNKWAEVIQLLEQQNKVKLGSMVTKSEHRFNG